MDCFYAAVEVKHNPDLKGKPLGIGGPPNSRSVLCTASYEARKFGVRAAMPSSHAVRLCPNLVLVPPNFELYRKESKAVRAILEDYTKIIEPLSLDEAYLDVTSAAAHGGIATAIAQEIRQRIESELSLTASAGIAPNKFLAKIASDWKKPNGQFVIRPSDIQKFMPTLPVEKIWGVGKVTAKKMHSLGIKTCGDIQKKSMLELQRLFGSRGTELMALAKGIDSREVVIEGERKSLTVEETYNKDLKTLDECLAQFPKLYVDWDRRMQKISQQSQIKGWVVKAKYFDFKSITREAASTMRPTLEDFTALMRRVWSHRAEPIRLLGLGVRLQNVTPTNSDQLTLWQSELY